MLGFIAVLGSLWLAPPCGTPACSCVPPRDVPTSLQQADAVFTARVRAVRNVTVRGYRMRRVTLRVDRAWKGVEARDVAVMTGSGGGDCGFDFRRRQVYLVYAHRANSGSLHAGICGRTATLAGASADIRQLGEPTRRFR